MELVIDGYPVKKYHYKGTFKQPSGYKELKLLLVEKYRVCYFCRVEVRVYPNQENVSNWQPDDMATIDHLYPRTRRQFKGRRKYQVVEKVLACHKCNTFRNEEFQCKGVNYLKEKPPDI